MLCLIQHLSSTALLSVHRLEHEAATYNNHTDLQEYTETVTAYIKKCIDDVTVTKTITTRANQKMWMTAEVRGLLKTRDEAFRSGDKAAQGRPKPLWGPKQNFIWGPLGAANMVIVKAWLFTHYKSNTPIISFVCCSCVAYIILSACMFLPFCDF